jgi:hypothetical protein
VCEDYGHLLVVNSVVSVDASINIKDDEDVKLIPRKITVLEDNSEFKEKTIIKDDTEFSGEGQSKLIFIKVPSQNSSEYHRIRSFLKIFNEGDLPVIFYDNEKSVYLKDNVMLTKNSEFIIGELKSLAGKENVVTK